MAVTTRYAERPDIRNFRLTPGLLAVLGWQIISLLGGLFAITQILQLDDFFNLGPVVKYFMAAIVGVYCAVGVYSAVMLVRGHNYGRMGAMFYHLVGAVLSSLYLAHLLGLYIGIDALAAGLYEHAVWLVGLAVGYVIIWLAQRLFEEDSQPRFYVERLGIGVLLLSLMILLLQAGLINAIIAILGALLQPAALLVAGMTAAFIISAVYLSRQSVRFGETSSQRETWEGWLFLLPNFVSFMLFFAGPLLLSFYLSFTNYDAVSRAEWVGLENYGRTLSVQFLMTPNDATPTLYTNYGEVARLPLGNQSMVFAARDPLFWQTMATTFRFCALLLTLAVLPALGLAILLNSKIPGMKLFRALFFLPSIAAVVGVALVWQWLYNPVIGFINYALANLAALFGQTDPNIQWLTDDAVLLLAVVIMAAWQVIGFNTVIFLAGLQGVNKEILEAATVDGADAWLRFRSIVMPLIAPTTFFVTVTTLISGLQAFSEFYVLLGSSTSNGRLTTVYYLYLQGFRDFQFGRASSMAWVLFAVIFVVTLIQFRLSSRAEAYSD